MSRTIVIIVTLISLSQSGGEISSTLAFPPNAMGHGVNTRCNSPYTTKRAMDEYCHRKFDALVNSIHNFSNCIMQNSLSYDACASCGDHFQFYNETKYDVENDVRQDECNRLV